jgi:hypothetical protein
MVTNYPHQIASRGMSPEGEAHQEDDGVGTGMLSWVNQLFCSIRGHDRLLQFEQHRMFLRCMSCGHESPGWALDEAPPTLSLQTEAPPQAARVRPHLVSERRIA